LVVALTGTLDDGATETSSANATSHAKTRFIVFSITFSFLIAPLWQILSPHFRHFGVFLNPVRKLFTICQQVSSTSVAQCTPPRKSVLEKLFAGNQTIIP
jgi:hypothetical protein